MYGTLIDLKMHIEVFSSTFIRHKSSCGLHFHFISHIQNFALFVCSMSTVDDLSRPFP